MKRKTLTCEIKAVDEQNYTISAVFSTNDEDRDGEIVDQKGWLLSEYLLNPVVLLSHNTFDLPVAQIQNLRVEEDATGRAQLAGDVKFAVEEYEVAKTVYNLYKGKFMRAFSAGFQCHKVERENEKVILRENTLYEVSCVSVPANALALAKSKGVDVSAYEELQAEDVQKSIEEIAKSGRVISAKNRKTLEAAREAIDAVLRADDKEEESEDEDKSIATPTPKVARNRALNKAIRALVEAKKL